VLTATRHRWVLLFAFALLCAGASSAQQPAARQAQSNSALLLAIHDAIGPATSDFFVRALDRAQDRKAQLVIVELDTPGGLDSAMRDMIKAMLASRVPVVIYVSPSGARAASAGTYLLYASHIAAMAPATNLGAATPIQIGAPSGQDDHDKDSKPEPGTAEERKAINDAVAYIRGLAELRGRNADWAESAVRTAASLPASAALEQKVVDVIARDVADLLEQIDGRIVKVSTGELRLATRGLMVERTDPDWRMRLLATLTNPNVAYLLMLVGIYGLLLEGYNPGAILPGVAGAICLLLALYAFQVLSVNYAGLGLILLGLALLVGEAFVPSFGSLGIGGIAAFVIGSIILLDTGVPGFEVARSLIGGIAFAGALLILLIASYFARSRKRPVVTGAEQLLTEPAIALSDFERSGRVRVRGEIWNAIARAPVKEGQRLRIVRIDGLTLAVEPDERAE
jgi:membrane-bound serine protease (ClpP class)